MLLKGAVKILIYMHSSCSLLRCDLQHVTVDLKHSLLRSSHESYSPFIHYHFTCLQYIVKVPEREILSWDNWQKLASPEHNVISLFTIHLYIRLHLHSKFTHQVINSFNYILVNQVFNQPCCFEESNNSTELRIFKED